MNCPFCATGQQGLTRNLSTAEIVEQVVAGARYLKQMKGLEEAEGGSEDTRPLRVSNIVFMGMGEALANYKSTMGAIHRLIDPAPEGLGISARGLTMSTVGLVPGIRKFEMEKLPITLALSLHALIRDINDQGWRADLLGKKLAQRGRGWVHVNPIPLNPTPGSKWTASRKGVEQNFVERLRAHGIPTTIRDTRGSDIDGACGQLAAKEEE